MKKILVAFIVLISMTTAVFADGVSDARKFFDSYVNAANSYSDTITGLYSPNAKIIRQVVKPDGKTVDVYTDTATYVKQMKLSQSVAKMRKYKNYYSNITVSPLSGGAFKISSLRRPTGESYKLKTYMIIKKQPDGKWKIIEEMMQTKEQIFLRYAK